MNKEQNYKSIITRIWQVCSHVRGVMSDMQLQQVVIALTILRRIDCLIGQYAKESSEFYSKKMETLSDERIDQKLREISGGYPFYNYSGYTFSGILLANNSIEVVLNSYLQGYSKNVADILEEMNFKQNLATLQRQSRYLVELFQFFSEIDLSNTSIGNEEFVEIITSLTSEGSHEFNTSLELSRLISECLFAEDIYSDNEDVTSIYDPVCGTGSMLALASEKAKSIGIHQANISLSGQEISIFHSAIAKALVLLSGNDESKVFYGNTLTEDLFFSKRFHYILADLPLGIQWRPIKDRIEKESLDANGRFFIGLPSVSNSQFLFIEHILSKMNPNGCRAAFITTASVLWSGTASSGESRIRRWLFENDLVETIIALPAGTLTGGLPVYLWIISNKKNDAQKGKVCLIDASLLISKENLDILLNNDNFVQCVVAEYKKSTVSLISKTVKNEQFGYYEVILLENGKKKEKVTISLDTDIDEFVAKEWQPYAKGIITIDYSSAEKGYSVLFEKFFAQEQNDVISMADATKDLMSAIDAMTSLKTDIVRFIGQPDSKSWTEMPLRAAVELVLGASKKLVPNLEGLPLLSVKNLRSPSMDDTLYEVTPRTKCSTIKDVIVIVTGANSGEVFRGVDGILTSSVASVKCINNNVIAHQYLYYLLKGYEKELMSKAKGFIKSLNSKSILDIRCKIPPIEEQLKLASYLDDIIGKIDDVINVLGGTNTIFSSYRQTLIENVVRGSIVINDINKRED